MSEKDERFVTAGFLRSTGRWVHPSIPDDAEMIEIRRLRGDTLEIVYEVLAKGYASAVRCDVKITSGD